MLAKSNLSKLLLISLLLLCSCSGSVKDIGIYHTEVICPNKDVILIRFIAMKDARKAIEKAYEKRKNYRTNENYTILTFGKNISVKLDGILPSNAMQCQLREIHDSKSDPDKAKYLHPAKHRLWSTIN